MSKAYSEDLRQRIVEAVEGGMSRRQAAARYKVGVSSAIRYVQRWRATGSVKQDRMGQPGGSKLDPHQDWILKLIEDEPDLTLSANGCGMSIGPKPVSAPCGTSLTAMA